MNDEFKKLLEKLFIDPVTKEQLYIKRDLQNKIIKLEGKQEKSWPLEDDVFDFVGNNNYASNFGDQWTKFPKLQLDSFTGTTISADRFWKATKLKPSDLKGKTVLDVGCGIGRFSEIALDSGAYVVALDYSEASKVAAKNLKKYENYICVQGNIYNLPFKERSFDFVYCLGVLQHTPNVELAFKKLVPMVKIDGDLIVDYYSSRLKTIIGWKYIVRIITSRLDENKVFKILKHIHPFFYKTSELIIRLPFVGRILSRMIPVANYRKDYPQLGDKLLKDWSFLDTYDAWAPKYDNPQSISKIRRWANDMNLKHIETEYAGHLVLRAKVPDCLDRLSEINIISDLATPHNNSLIQELRKNEKTKILAWYSYKKHHELPWKKALATNDKDYYFNNLSNQLKLIYKIIISKKSKFLIIGYSNLVNRFAILWFAITFREYYFWLDHPEERKGLRNIFRSISYSIISSTVTKCFTIGEKSKKFLVQNGFNTNKIYNFSLYINVPSDNELQLLNKNYIRSKFNLSNDTLILTAASRITKLKGFHILIEALTKLKEDTLKRVILVIVGDGPYKNKLQDLSKRYHLDEKIFFLNWAEPNEYREIIYSSDIFIHPSIFDAYGAGSIYAMSMSIPVIGSSGAGVVQERVVHELNGLVYDPYDKTTLVENIEKLVNNNELRFRLSQQARKTSFDWTSKIGAKKLFTEIGIIDSL